MQALRWLTMLLWAGFSLLGTAQVWAAAPKPLVMGIFPYMNSYAVVSKFVPVRDYLASQLGRPIQVFTAPDFRTFIERTQKGEYDIALTAPHFARMAINEANYVALATYKSELKGVVIVKRDSPIRQLAELRGKSVAVPDKLAIVTMVGTQLLRDAGLQPDNDYTLVVTRSHSSAALSVLNGQHAAAIIGSAPYKQLPQEQQDGLHIIGASTAFPTQHFIAHKRLGDSQIEQIRLALLQFAEKVPAGRQFIEDNHFLGIRASDGTELKNMDAYVLEVKRLLAEKAP